MLTQYGQLNSNDYLNYLKLLRTQIWKLIPLKQEKCVTISSYINRINRTLCGLINICNINASDFITIMSLLENAKTETNFSNYRADILKCCRILLEIIEQDGDYNV